VVFVGFVSFVIYTMHALLYSIVANRPGLKAARIPPRLRYSTFDVGSLSGGAGKGLHDAVYGRSEHEACYDAADLSHRLNSHY
jgi:hypothetical protein